MSFFHLDYTIGKGIAPFLHLLVDYHHRSGISPCPEDLFCFALLNYSEYSATVNTYRTLTRVTHRIHS